MTFAQTERAELCDLFDEVGPDAPTLCEGWLTRDLAVHLWIRENDPLASAGLVVKPLAARTTRRTDELKAGSFTELVDRFRQGPRRLSPLALSPLDTAVNAVEFFVHHEDVRRAGDAPRPPRDIGLAVEDWLWRRLRLMGRGMMRHAPVGVVLERSDDEAPVDPAAENARTHDEEPAAAVQRREAPDSIRVASGSHTVTLIGHPSELLLYAYGRKPVAHLRKVGTADAVARLDAA